MEQQPSLPESLGDICEYNGAVVEEMHKEFISAPIYDILPYDNLGYDVLPNTNIDQFIQEPQQQEQWQGIYQEPQQLQEQWQGIYQEPQQQEQWQGIYYEPQQQDQWQGICQEPQQQVFDHRLPVFKFDSIKEKLNNSKTFVFLENDELEVLEENLDKFTDDELMAVGNVYSRGDGAKSKEIARECMLSVQGFALSAGVPLRNGIRAQLRESWVRCHEEVMGGVNRGNECKRGRKYGECVCAGAEHKERCVSVKDWITM